MYGVWMRKNECIPVFWKVGYLMSIFDILFHLLKQKATLPDLFNFEKQKADLLQTYV